MENPMSGSISNYVFFKWVFCFLLYFGSILVISSSSWKVFFSTVVSSPLVSHSSIVLYAYKLCLLMLLCQRSTHPLTFVLFLKYRCICSFNQSFTCQFRNHCLCWLPTCSPTSIWLNIRDFSLWQESAILVQSGSGFETPKHYSAGKG